MSATDIIQEIQKLPVTEQEQVLDFLQKARNERKAPAGSPQYIPDADFEKVADNVFRKHADLFRRLAE